MSAVLRDAVLASEDSYRFVILLPPTLTELPHVGNVAVEGVVGPRPHHVPLGLHHELLLALSDGCCEM